MGEKRVDPAELREWWIAKATAEIDATLAKAAEYGGGMGRSLDLVDIGRDLLRMTGLADDDISDPESAEAGVYFYLRGKLARWTAALTEGREVSNDTIFDILVYARMAQRIREFGGWPI